MKKYSPYLVAIFAISLLIGWYLYSNSEESINQREGDFAVKGTVTKIVLDDADGKHLTLALNNGKWLVNDKYAARPELVSQLLDAVTHLSSLAPVPRAAHDNVIRELLAQHVQVQVFTGKDKPQKVYYVGGPAVDNRNTYMLLFLNGKPASRPHLMYVPGYDGYLTPRFSTDEENWRSRLVFDVQEGDIDSLSVEYPNDEAASFSIARATTDSFVLSPLNEKYRIRQLNEQRYVKQYLGFFNSIYVETFDNDFSKKDSVLQTMPYCRFTLKKADGTSISVRLFYMPITARTKADYDLSGKKLDRDVDKFYADINHRDFAIVQYYVFGKLLRSYKDFYYKPKG